MCFCLDESGNRMLSENHSSHQSPRVCDSIYVKPGQQRGEQADGVTPEGCRVVFWGEEHVLKLIVVGADFCAGTKAPTSGPPSG